ncbi:ribosome maturation factor RimM [Chloroflexota bacterium]
MELTGLEFVTVGRILAPWGIGGKLKVQVITDFPQRFVPSAKVYINRQLMIIECSEFRRGGVVIKLESINGIEEAQKLQGQLIEIHHTQLQPLPEGQYYHFQLIGLDVWTTHGELIGTVTSILTAANNDNYVVSTKKGEILIPAIEDVVKSIEVERKRIVIEAIKGLLTLNN